MTVQPIVVRFMLACATSNGNPELLLRPATWNSQAGRDARQWLRTNDLITDGNFATERGEEWVEDLCDTPLPAPATAQRRSLRR